MAMEQRNTFFEDWFDAWGRRLGIAQALNSVHPELDESMRRFEIQCRQGASLQASLPPPEWSRDRTVSPEMLESALTAIDLFPRCVLTLTVFEKISVRDTATLLSVSEKLVRCAMAFATQRLAENIARAQGWNPAPATAPSSDRPAASSPAFRLCSVP
jgi:DNA-directed RNA polymerase specialized sigma24 family protein